MTFGDIVVQCKARRGGRNGMLRRGRARSATASGSSFCCQPFSSAAQQVIQESEPELTLRILDLVDGKTGAAAQVHHFSLLGWPDHGVPSQTRSIRRLCTIVQDSFRTHYPVRGQGRRGPAATGRGVRAGGGLPQQVEGSGMPPRGNRGGRGTHSYLGGGGVGGVLHRRPVAGRGTC